MTGERVDLWLDGAAALAVAEAAVGAPGWPPLQRLVVGRVGTFGVLLAGWPLGCYMYPVPRGRVEQGPWMLAQRETVDAALRGEAEALRRVAIELARVDRKAVAS